MKHQLTIFISDDHPVFREGLIRVIEKEKQFRITGSAGNGNDAADFIRMNKPDIAILDISMPGCSGLEIARQIKKEFIPTIPVILTMYDEEEYLQEALANGVKGYLLKDSTLKEIISCIKTVMEGGLYISNQLAPVLTKPLKKGVESKSPRELIMILTNTEKQVLRLLSENKTSVQIAETLCISFRTVQNHRINISSKLKLNGHNSLLLFAIENKALL